MKSPDTLPHGRGINKPLGKRGQALATLYAGEDHLSIHATSWAFKVQNISSSAKFVLIALADAHNGHTGECFPRVKRIMAMTLLGESTVRRLMLELEEARLITREMEFDDSGRTRGIRYALMCDKGGARSGPPGARSKRGEGPKSSPPIKNNGKEGTGTFKRPCQEQTPSTGMALEGDGDEAWPFGRDGETFQ